VGPWINGGAWVQVEGLPVDWLYRELGQVLRVIDECRAGRSSVYYQTGYTHGFRTHIVLARPGESPTQLETSVNRLYNLLDAVEDLCWGSTSAREAEHQSPA
jgi:hypothetical protein